MLSGCRTVWECCVFGHHYINLFMCVCVNVQKHIYVYWCLFCVHFLFCIMMFGWLLFSSTFTALLKPSHCTQAFPPSCAVNFLSTSSSSSLLPSTLFSSPLLLSYVDEIRWFLLGEASVHPSAASSRARPTPSTQVINKPANSHSPSMTYCLFSTSAVLYVRPCPHAAPCELTASQHTDRPLDFSIYLAEKEACLRMFWTEVTDGSLGHVAMLKEEQQIKS